MIDNYPVDACAGEGGSITLIMAKTTATFQETITFLLLTTAGAVVLAPEAQKFA
jgi:hypothetical protein